MNYKIFLRRQIDIQICLFLFFVSAFSVNAQKLAPVLMAGESLNYSPNVEEFITQKTIPQKMVDGHYYKLLQFQQIPTPQEKENLLDAGVELLQYIPHNAYYAKISEKTKLQKLKPLGVLVVKDIETSWKVSPALQDRQRTTSKEKLAVTIVAMEYKTINPQQLQKLGIKQFEIENKGISASCQVTSDQLEKLANATWVGAIAQNNTSEEVLGDKDMAIQRANLIDNNLSGANNLNYDASGISIIVGDNGAIGPHVDFKGRLENLTTPPGGTHADRVGGLITAAGNISPHLKSAASGALLYSKSGRLFERFGDVVELYHDKNVTVATSSYVHGTYGGSYNLGAVLYDQEAHKNSAISSILPSGNKGDNDFGYGAGPGWGTLVGDEHIAKQMINVGMVDPLGVRYSNSCNGPTADGRLKPDLMALGQTHSTWPYNKYKSFGGTSAAAPNLTGNIAQLLQVYKEHNNGQDPSAALIKAAALNSATDLGNPGPDWNHGYGLIHTKRAHDILANNQYIEDEGANTATNIHTFDVPAGVAELRVMLYWSDPAPATNATRILVNDLDINVNANGTNYLPLVLDNTPDPLLLSLPAVPGIDRLNNTEQVVILNPTAGQISVNVDGYEVGQGNTQKYVVVYTFIYDEIEVTYPVGGEKIWPATRKITWDAYGDSGDFTIEYSADNGSSWNLITDAAPADLRVFDWVVPALETKDALIRITRGTLSDTSDEPFTVLALPTNLKFTAVSANSANFTFNPVANATAYDIYVLGDKYMELHETITSTTYTFDNLGGAPIFVSVAARVGDIVGNRAKAISYLDDSFLGCTGCLNQISDFPITEVFVGNELTSSFSYYCNDAQNELDWVATNLASPTPNTGPSGPFMDYRYLLLQATAPNKTARLLSPCLNLENKSNANISFAYHMNGAQMGSLSVEVSTDGGTTWSGNIWATTGSIGDFWCQGQADLTPYLGPSVIVRFVGITGNGIESDIGLDNVIINASDAAPCDPSGCAGCATTVADFPYVENFRYEGLSTFCNDIRDNSDWKDSGNQAEFQTCSSNKTARFVSPIFDLRDFEEAYFSYSYNTYGYDLAELSLEISLDGGQFWSAPLWTNPSNPDVAWYNHKINLTPFIGGQTMIRFVGKTGSNASTKIGLDNFLIEGITYDRDCPFIGCIQCSKLVDVFPFVENFNNSYQYFCDDLNDDTDWSKISGPTPTQGTGPNDGFLEENYLYLESLEPNLTARLLSPKLDLTGAEQARVVFYYHMEGADMGSLFVEASSDGGQTWSAPIFTISGDQGGAWVEGYANITPFVSSETMLRFTGITGDGPLSDIGLDRVIVELFDDLSNCPTIASPQAIVTHHNTCFGGEDGAIYTANASGGEYPYYYYWGNGVIGKWQSSLPAGIYSLTVSDANGCTAYGPTLEILDGPAFDFGLLVNAPTFSELGSAYAAPSGGQGAPYSFLWSTGATTSSVSNLCPGSYSLTVSDSDCEYIEDFIINGVNSCEVVDVEDFESGWGIWNDGGNNCRRNINDNPYASSGQYCIRVQSRTNSSFLTSDPLDLSAFESVNVDFDFEITNFSVANHDFWLQVSNDGGTSFTTIESWAWSSGANGYSNNVRYTANASIEMSNLSTASILRIRCHAGNVSTRLYVDDVTITGCYKSSPDLIAPANEVTSLPTQNDFTWSAISGATSYVFQLSGDATFDFIVEESTLSGTSYLSAVTLSEGEHYYWRVKAILGCVETEWSSPFTFGTAGCLSFEEEDFEEGWGIWNDGGNPSRRFIGDAPFAASGEYCVRLIGKANGAYTETDVLDLANSEDVAIQFTFMATGMTSPTHDFWLQKSLDGGATYEVLETWEYTVDFDNDQFYTVSYVVPAPFSTTTVFRIRLHAGTAATKLYLDDISLAECTDVNNPIARFNTTATTVETKELTNFLDAITVYPNPTKETIHLNYNADLASVSIVSATGQVIRQIGRLEQGSAISVQDLAPGIYFLNIRDAKEETTKRFVKF